MDPLIASQLRVESSTKHIALPDGNDIAILAQVLEPACAGQGSQAQCALLIDRLDQLVTASGLAPRLRDHGIAESDIPALAREAMKQQRLLVNNPRPIDEDDARRLYEVAW